MGLVDLNSIAPCILGGIAGCIGILHQLVDVFHGLVDVDDADARGKGEVAILPIETVITNRFELTLGDLYADFRSHLLEERSELVAAEAREGATRTAQLVPELTRQNLEKLIPRGVTGGVVDDFELVEIRVQHDVTLIFGMRSDDGFLQPVLKLLAVDEPGELVVARLIRKLVVHVLQHSVRCALHERQVELVENENRAVRETLHQLA